METMIEWLDIAGLPREVTLGRSFLFCTFAQHVFHVTLVQRDEGSLCWSIGGPGPQAPLLLDRDMAIVTHFAEPNLPHLTEGQLAAAATRVANLDGRGLAYQHDRYGR